MWIYNDSHIYSECSTTIFPDCSDTSFPQNQRKSPVGIFSTNVWYFIAVSMDYYTRK